MRKWQKYEEHILTKLEEQFPDSEILSNQKMRGRYSKTKRQVDVLLRGKLAKWDMLAVVACKCFSRKINVKSVDQFIGMVNDIGGHVGVMFTNMGYSPLSISQQQIRIVDIIAAIGKAVSPRFLSKSLDLDERVVLAQLKRLQKSGLIDVHHDGQKVMKVSTKTDFTLWHLFRTKRDIENIREETLRVLFNRDLVKPFHYTTFNNERRPTFPTKGINDIYVFEKQDRLFQDDYLTNLLLNVPKLLPPPNKDGSDDVES